MLSSSELGLDKAGVVPLLKGHRVGPGRVGVVSLPLGPFSRSREQMDVFPWYPAECARSPVPHGGPLRFWFPDYPRLLVTSLGLASGRWASCELESYFQLPRRLTHCLKALLASQFMVRCFTTLFFPHSFFCPFHWLSCDLVVVGERLVYTPCVIEGLTPPLPMMRLHDRKWRGSKRKQAPHCTTYAPPEITVQVA